MTAEEGNMGVGKGNPFVHIVNIADLFPFTPIIMETPMADRWIPPTFEKYDGSIDLDEHLRMFVNHIAFYTISDLVWCRAFSLSLKEEALTWFNSLPHNSIDNIATVYSFFANNL